MKLGAWNLVHDVNNMHVRHLGRYLEGQGHSLTLKQNCVRPITLLFSVRIKNYFTEMIACQDDMSREIFGLLPWRSRSQHDLEAKSCLDHNFIIWCQILKLFHRNDHLIETMCSAQYLSRSLEGQGHSMTLQQKHVKPITSLFVVGFYNYLTEMITILRWCVTTFPIVLALCVLYCIILRSVILIASFSGLQKNECVHFVGHNYSFLSESYIINDNKQELMISQELFEGPVGNYYIALKTIKCLFKLN